MITNKFRMFIVNTIKIFVLISTSYLYDKKEFFIKLLMFVILKSSPIFSTISF